jgi:translation initiation factor IF-3
MGYDLVEVSPGSSPPVCKILDFGKYLYNLKKKDRESRKHQRHTDLKEVKFSIKIFEHDYQTKLNHCKEFLEKGHKIKATIFLRGREMTRVDFGIKILNRLAGDLADYGNIEKDTMLEGNIISLMFAPKSGKNSASKGRKEHGQETETQNEQGDQKAV